MSSEVTDVLALFKAIPNTAEPFRTTDLNDNWDLVDVEAGLVRGRLTAVEGDVATLEGRVDDADGRLESLESTVGIGLTVFVQSSEPTANAVGDLWFW
jgi:hypothetical protein